MQTAVEWLIEQINDQNQKALSAKEWLEWLEVFDQAKQMEKEQMIKFAMEMHEVDCSKTGIDLLLDEAEQYYNKTYSK
jgi:hypothetical protein